MGGKRTGESTEAELARLRNEIERLRFDREVLLRALRYVANEHGHLLEHVTDVVNRVTEVEIDDVA